MAKGKRISDPAAKQMVEEKLRMGVPFTEKDRKELKKMARLDLIAMLELQGFTLKAATKNSVENMITFLLSLQATSCSAEISQYAIAEACPSHPVSSEYYEESYVNPTQRNAAVQTEPAVKRSKPKGRPLKRQKLQTDDVLGIPQVVHQHVPILEAPQLKRDQVHCEPIFRDPVQHYQAQPSHAGYAAPEYAAYSNPEPYQMFHQYGVPYVGGF